MSGGIDPAEPIGVLQALLLGAVEGLTEFLPVSSTGHLILVNAWLGRSDPALEIAIQAGAILAIVVLYWRRLTGSLRDLVTREPAPRNLLVLIVVAATPAALAGLALESAITERLFTPTVVALALVLGGVALWGIERWLRHRPEPSATDRPTLRQAIVIGLFQCLALIPGTSRSGATIAGGLLAGCSRQVAAEFSFLVGLPILLGASALKFVNHADRLTGPLLVDFLVASAAAFLTALAVVAPFVAFLRRHTFVPFAVYRILLGGVLLLWIAAGG